MADSNQRKTAEDVAHEVTPTVTGRAVRRAEEDAEYTAVILKRTDETHRHPDDILEAAIRDGLEQLERPVPSLALSSVAAGSILGFTAMAVGVVTALVEPLAGSALSRLVVAAVYPLGFVVCMMSGTELFTEHTATAVYPVLDRRASIPLLLRLWGVVLVGNIVGAGLSARLLVTAEAVIQAREGYIAVGGHLVEFAVVPLLASALLAGWLMALGAWLILATPPTVSQMLSIYVVTFLIGLGGLHHSIAGSAEILTAYFVSDQFTLWEVVRFIGLAVVGNLCGGSLFVAVLNYGHIRQSQMIS